MRCARFTRPDFVRTFRNVSSKVPRFHEEFINTGHVDMAKAVRLYREAGFRGVLIDDHVPRIPGDKPFPGNLGGYRSRMFASAILNR